MAGRHTKLTREVHDNIVAAVLNGNAAETAAEAYGVSESAFYDWLARGRSEPDSVFAEFLEAVQRARAQAEMHAVSALRLGFEQDPKFAVEWLKRARHKRWSEKQEHEVRVGALEGLSDEELERRALEKSKQVIVMLNKKTESDE